MVTPSQECRSYRDYQIVLDGVLVHCKPTQGVNHWQFYALP